MTPPDARSTRKRPEILLFLVLLAVGFLYAAMAGDGGAPVSHEATIREGVAQDLLDGLTRGRQGLVGSLYWAPLPTLLGLFFVRFPAPFGEEHAYVIVSLLAAAALGAFLFRWLRRSGVGGFAATLASAAVFLSPPVLGAALAGRSDPLLLLLATAAVCFLMHWRETGALRSLAYLGVATAAAVLVRYQAVLLLACAAALVACRARARNRKRGEAEATFVILLAPGLYVIALWLAANWLIMGEWGFFLRGLLDRGADASAWFAALVEGCPWGPLLVLMAAAAALWALRLRFRQRGALLKLAPVAAACLVLWFADLRLQPGAPADAELPVVVADLRKQYARDWIVVAGYRGYELQSGDFFLHHSLSLYLDETLERTHGKRTYLLTPEPVGRDRWEDARLKYPDLYERGAAFALFERSWDHWRLWRVVRLDETDRR